MIEYLKDWYHRNLSNPQAVILVLMIVLGTIIILYWREDVAPVQYDDRAEHDHQHQDYRLGIG